MASNFKDLYRLDIVHTVQNLIARGSKLKFNLFKTIISQNDVDKRVIDEYLMSIDSFLDTWEEYADSLEDAMKDATPKVGVYAHEYDDFKPFFYANYDYASILPFADGIIQGIDSGKFETAEDINDFFEYTVSKAFKDRADSTAGLLDETVELIQSSQKAADRVAINLFTAVKRQNLFSPRDRKELYKASEKVLKFLCHSVNDRTGMTDDRTPKIMIASINNVVEYVTYSLTAYATRIYAIAQYAGPFIRSSINESVVYEASGSTVEYTVMRDMDEMMFRDIDRIVETTSKSLDFLSKIGVDVEPIKPYSNGLLHHHPANAEHMLKNQFTAKLISNELREYVCNKLQNDIGRHLDQFNTFENISVINKRVADMVYNKNQALGTATTPCQEIVHVIRGTVPEHETVTGYQELSKDLMIFSLSFMGEIATIVQNLNYHRSEDHDRPLSVNKSFSFRNNAAELVKTLTDLYKEIALATLKKARDIEMHLNVIHNTQDAKIASDLTIKVPGDPGSDVNMNDDMMCGVPDTTRMPVAIDNLYAIPTMEYLVMYDEYVHSILGDDPYYEAGGVATIIEKIKAWLAGKKKSITRFFTSAAFSAAVDWVNKHKEQLSKMTFTQQMTVKGYAKDINIAHIDTIINKISNFKDDDAKDQDSVDKFIANLYNDGQTNWGKYFGIGDNSAEKLNAEQRALRYQNVIIFGGNANENGANDVEKYTRVKTLTTSKEISDELQIWIGNVSASSDTYKALINKCDALDRAFESMKGKVTNLQQKKQQAANSAAKQETAPSMGDSKNDVQQEAADTAQPTTDVGAAENQDFTTVLLTKTETAILNLWGNVFPAIVRSIKEQYQYIQEAYSKGNKPQQ